MTLREHVDALGDFLGQRHLSDRYSRGALAQAFLASRSFIIADLQAKGQPLPVSAWTRHVIAVTEVDNSSPQCWEVACDNEQGTVAIPQPLTNSTGTPLLRLSLHDGTDVAYRLISEHLTLRYHPVYANCPVYVADLFGGRLQNLVGQPQGLIVEGVFEDPRQWIGIVGCDGETPTCRDIMDVEVGMNGPVASRAYEYVLRQARNGMVGPVDTSSDDDASAK